MGESMKNLSTKAVLKTAALPKANRLLCNTKSLEPVAAKRGMKSAINRTHFSTYTFEVGHSESQSFVCAPCLHSTLLSKEIQLKAPRRNLHFLTESISVHPRLITPVPQ